MSEDNTILVIDETLREGMQYSGVMFSLKQRLEILRFQEKLGVDICQAGYPPAHETEKDIVTALARHAENNNYRIRIAAMGRLGQRDAATLIQTGIKDLHFHIHLDPNLTGETLNDELDQITDTAESIKKNCPDAVISIAMLDIGRAGNDFLESCVRRLDLKTIDILSLPDTSGMMAPNQVFDTISRVSENLKYTKISIHCHNDMGMSNANGVMGIVAGGTILEATALGIGERNGLSDLYPTATQLKAQGYRINLNTEDRETFQKYYAYVDNIVFEQTGVRLLTVNTPGFGDAVKTHVAGTHAEGKYGLHTEEKIYLNGLCGKHLVKKYLALHRIDCPENLLGRLTLEIKNISFKENRSVSPSDIGNIVASIQDGIPF